MSDNLKVVPIGVPNLADIAAMLEDVAARIRDGETLPPARAVLILLVGKPGERQIAAYDFGSDAGSTMMGALGMCTAAQFHFLGAINA